jgi:tRNA A-37 threonylcarbamoyl transferase component Bud32
LSNGRAIADLRSWCELAIRRERGDASQVRRVSLVPSRTGVVYRVDSTNDGPAIRHYFLKQFDEEIGSARLQDRLRQLAEVSAALQQEPGITPYVVVASDVERRLLLARQVEGQPILSLHRTLSRRAGFGAEGVVEAWRGVGIWLATLHRKTLSPLASQVRAVEVEEYTKERLLAWAAADPRRAKPINAALEALHLVASRCADQTLTLTPCHGDISGYNILVSGTVGLIDFDDIRFDLPALDLSQAAMELRNLSRTCRVVPLRHVAARAEAALRAGYGEPLPDGAPFWIQHFRNLSVFGLTLARRLTGVSLSRLTDELHYRRILTEFESTTKTVLTSEGARSFWDGRRG